MELCHTQCFRGLLPSLYLILLICRNSYSAYAPEARWAQTTVKINDALFVHGGKVDPFNSYSYTSAPNVNDLLYLPLSQSFDVANPPWQLVSSSGHAPNSQDPAVAWHTISAFNSTSALLFGGQPTPNDPPYITDWADSAFLLDLSSPTQPIWYPEAPSWGGQPVRRVYHSSSTSASGVIYIIGGEKADGSGNAFSEHFEFDPQTLTFFQLPSENAPPAIYGHASVMLGDDRLVVFGGVSQGTLTSFSSVWVLDTSKNAWTQLQVDADSLPQPRRAFAAVSIGQGKILIQGGSDASLQNNLDDGWILDTSQSPAVWVLVEQLSKIGARRDHCAVFSNGMVIFGFGYSNSGPASSALQVFDLSSKSFTSSYTPPSPTASVTQTMPGGSGTPTGTATHHPGSPTSGGGGATHPTSTLNPNGNDGNKHDKSSVAAIAVGATLGGLGVIAAGAAVVIHMQRRRKKRRAGNFMAIGGDDDEGNSSLHAGSTIPAATMYTGDGAATVNKWGNGLLGTAFGIASTITAATKLRNVRGTYQRRDMLADEDTREFGEWYNARRRDGTGGSSWSLARSILGTRFRSREPSTYSHGSASHRQEKTDPFSDGTSLMQDPEPGTPDFEVTLRPQNRRETNYISTSSYSYIDPFADPVHEKTSIPDTEYEPTSTINAVSRFPAPPATVRMVPPVPMSEHPLSPLSEHTSNTSLPSNDHTTSSSHIYSNETRLETVTSYTTMRTTTESSPSHITTKSLETLSSPTALPSTIVPASVSPVNVRRSDSWWSRFYRTGFLDRGSSSRSPVMPEIRDPKPLPSLDPIIEGLPKPSMDRIPSELEMPSSSISKVYATEPGNSMTSLRTADTERIERMAGTMDVMQRVHMRSQRTTGSVSSGLSIDTHATNLEAVGHELGVVSASEELPAKGDPAPRTTSHPPSAFPATFSLPTTPQRAPSGHSKPPVIPLIPWDNRRASDVTSSALPFASPSSPSSPSVADRVRMYERQISQDQEKPVLTNTRQREERSPKKNRISVDYGFVPRPNLFVANPDHRNSRSSDS
ncbi:Adagio-like protein 3 [Leucoagaricus sp. SymC.cos]|nr:Adagio-like protein 3 [Leucoagaricus sp. SymC.cos]